jgi:ABC-type transport system involved in multi-copper enzyme maturation permease subunit
LIWLSWRQFRTQAVVIIAAVGAVAVALAITRSMVVDLRADSGPAFLPQFATHRLFTTLYFVAASVVYALPAVLGAFWGAPMIARELETGTHRLVWNQSITRTRWLGFKLGTTGAAALVAGMVSLVVTWWCLPIDSTVNHSEPNGGFFSITRLSGVLLGARGIVPVGYTLLALAIGVTAGLLVRRTVPAMAVTLAATVAIQVLMPIFVAPHLIAPERYVVAISADNLRGLGLDEDDSVVEILVRVTKPGAWVTTNQTIDAEGKAADSIPADVVDCTAPQAGEVKYQPASRYWPLQWIQTGILTGLALVLAGFCFWRIRRDLS